MTGLMTLAGALVRGYLRDRAALFFTILFPLIFLFLLGGLLGGSKDTRSSVVLVGQVSVYDNLPAHQRARVNQVLTISRSHDLGAALADVRGGSEAAAVVQRGAGLVGYYSGANQASAGAVQSVMQPLVATSNRAAAGQAPRLSMQVSKGGDRAPE